jgi:exosortase A-associated hydrolase 2
VAYSVEPRFIAGGHGRLFVVRYRPPTPAPGLPGALLLPPFAEEMNRARRVAALQARALADSGRDVLIVDPFATGDSDGDFADARWEAWVADAVSAIDWLRDVGCGPVAIIGLRFGALLALAAAAARPDVVERVVLWQPVIRGDLMLTQFLRVLVAASLAEEAGAGPRASVGELRRRLHAGEPLEIAGYVLSPALAADMDRLRLADLGADMRCPVAWVEVAAAADEPWPAAGRSVIDGWLGGGVMVSASTVVGAPFWSIEDTVLCPALVETTTRLLAATPAQAA